MGVTELRSEPITIRRTNHGRVAILEIDYPGRTMNVVDERVLLDLGREFEALMADEAIDSMVLTSAKPGSFGAGADISWLPELAARSDAEAFLADVHDLMVRLVRSPKPMVAALNGAAFGGAFELALAAREIVAVPEATMGLPEVTLGLMPGGGGTQLLGRFVPIDVASDLLTSGRRLNAEEARHLGLVAAVIPRDRLTEEAVRRAAALVGQAQSERDETARGDAPGASRGPSSPAAELILEVLDAGRVDGLEAGLHAERKGFLTLLRSPGARSALHLFQAEADLKRRSGGGLKVSQLGVIGGGRMGAAIAAVAVSQGVNTVIRDVDDKSVQGARSYLDKVLARSAPAGGPDPRVDLWDGTTDWEGFDRAEVVVEAVFELPSLKTSVLSEVSNVVGADTLIGTNTSAISISDLATAVSRPERFLGMHFFNPVDRMPLVELIPHAGTSTEATSRAGAWCRQLGKVPVVVGDAPGFFTSRVYARWLIEGLLLLLDGASTSAIDGAAMATGFPAGPMLAHDEATLELVVQASIIQVAERVMTERLDVTVVRTALESLLAAGVRGRRHGLGFYRYDAEGRRLGPYEEVQSVLGIQPREVAPEEISTRLLLAFATECFLCWDDGTICHPNDGDVASVLGIGFPRHLGGPFHWADELGAGEIVARCRAFGGTGFPIGTSLPGMAGAGGRFADQGRRPAPFQDAASLPPE